MTDPTPTRDQLTARALFGAKADTHAQRQAAAEAGHQLRDQHVNDTATERTFLQRLFGPTRQTTDLTDLKETS